MHGNYRRIVTALLLALILGLYRIVPAATVMVQEASVSDFAQADVSREEKAAQGDPEAQFRLGVDYAAGKKASGILMRRQNGF